MGTFTISEDLDEMRHNVAFHQGLQFAKTKFNIRERNTIFFGNYNLWSLNIY